MDEKEIHRRYLAGAREGLLWKLDGLSERELRLPRTPTGTSLLGLVKHCTSVEAEYFGACLGRDHGIELPAVDFDTDPNGDLYATASESVDQLVANYRRVASYVEATIAELPLDAPAHVPWWGDRGDTTFRRLLVHVLYDVSRHAGQADIIRESIDGAAGMNRDNGNLWTPRDGWESHVEKLREIALRFP